MPWWRRRTSPEILALLTFRDEMRYLPAFFENVSPHVDGIIALDDGSIDGSNELVARQRNVIELISLPKAPARPDYEPINKRRLIEAALGHHPCWLLALDADERVERDFRTRALAEIERADREGILAYSLTLREIWNDPTFYRVDGIWGSKRVARLFRSRLDHEYDERPIHTTWAPLNSKRAGQYPSADLIIYHLRMLNRADRVARHAKFTGLDPNGRWQSIGYDYLLDEDGLQLEKCPAGREYFPMGE